MLFIMTKTIIECKNIWKIYKEGRVQALCGVSLKIRKGETLAILGPSGSGKSTLMHILGCLDRPSKGKVLIKGRDVSKLSDDELAKIRAKTIGFVFQFFYLVPYLTALENVMLPMIFVGEKNTEKCKELLKIVGLEKRANHLPMQLSGGERQRVAIARALANNPEIILADEPTGNLDSKTGEEIIKLLLDLNKKHGKTVVVVTHDSQLAKRMKRIIHIKDGKIIKAGG